MLERPRLRRYLRPGAAENFLILLRAEATVITSALHITLCRDPKDDVLLEVAAAGQANYLVSAGLDLTGDPYLKATIEAQHGVRVVTVLHPSSQPHRVGATESTDAFETTDMAQPRVW